MAGQKLSDQDRQTLIASLKHRFEQHMARHPGLDWPAVAALIEQDERKLWALQQMEQTGGEPDVVLLDGKAWYADCAAESPAGRRSLCYDVQALASRKENKPRHSAGGLAQEWGVALLSVAQYRAMQALFPFDQKTSSWVLTPDSIRGLGGSLFGDRRYDTVFIYHNGAESYYASRG